MRLGLGQPRILTGVDPSQASDLKDKHLVDFPKEKTWQ
jgi:hypothetical protein